MIILRNIPRSPKLQTLSSEFFILQQKRFPSRLTDGLSFTIYQSSSKSLTRISSLTDTNYSIL